MLANHEMTVAEKVITRHAEIFPVKMRRPGKADRGIRALFIFVMVGTQELGMDENRPGNAMNRYFSMDL